MFCLHRALFLAITFLACVAIAAPLVDVESQRVLSIEQSDGLGVVGQVPLQTMPAESAAFAGDDVQQTSLGARVLTTASKLFNRITKESASSSNQPIHFRRRTRVVRRRHP